jgi:hypothetical protein
MMDDCLGMFLSLLPSSFCLSSLCLLAYGSEGFLKGTLLTNERVSSNMLYWAREEKISFLCRDSSP